MKGIRVVGLLLVLIILVCCVTSCRDYVSDIVVGSLDVVVMEEMPEESETVESSSSISKFKKEITPSILMRRVEELEVAGISEKTTEVSESTSEEGSASTVDEPIEVSETEPPTYPSSETSLTQASTSSTEWEWSEPPETEPTIPSPVRNEAGELIPPSGEYGLVRGNCSDEQWQIAQTYWSHIPAGWRSKFLSDNWVMYITNDDFWTADGYSSLAGLTIFDLQVCYVRAGSSRIVATLSHEFGHYVDSVFNFPSTTADFAALYEKEKGTFEEYKSYDNHATSNTYEYFAAIFCQIIEAPDSESSAPESFEFVRDYYSAY